MARIEVFVAAGTSLAIRQPGKPAEWYTTKKEIVFDPATATEVDCPMGRRNRDQTSVRVSRIVATDIEVFFPRLVARSRLVLDAGDVDPAAFAQIYSCCQYDIPDESDYPNPSGWLRRIAVRDQKSGWLIKKGAISTARQIEMLDAGVILTIRDFADYETAGIVRDIVRSMYDEARALAESVAAREVEADAALAQAQASGATEAQARKAYETRAKAIARETAEKVAAMTVAAKNFGFAGADGFVDLQRISRIAAATKSEMAKKAAAYKQAATALAATGNGDAVAMAATMQNVTAGDVPVEAVADLLIENGLEAEASALAQAHHTGAYGAVLGGDTFSLTDDAT